jgi:hypothetical protein
VPRDDPSQRAGHRDALAEEVIAAILDTVRAMPDSPQKRQLGAKAESLQRALHQWRTSPSTAAQRAALRDVVLALHAKLREVIRRDSLDLTPGAGIRHAGPSSPASVNPLGRIRRRGA